MTSDLEIIPDGYSREVRRLTGTEARLDAEVRIDDRRFAGLRDFRTILELAAVRLELATLAVEGGRDAELARGKALAALQALDDLRGLSLSDDQSGVIRDSPEFAAAQAQLERFLMAGGAPLLEDRVADAERVRSLARIVASAVSKHAHRDDTYRPLFKTEQLREPLRSLLKALLPVSAREHQADPPYGLEEGQEEVRRAPRMTVPLPQAVHYLSEEVLPAYREALEADPGSAGLQATIAALERRIERLRTLRVYPRSTPLPIEPGVQTDALIGFTAEGVPLVTLGIGVDVRSGTNLDRMRELIQSEVVRRCAGGRFAPELDREYRRLAAGGRAGGGRAGGLRPGGTVPHSLRLDHRRLFPALRRAYPVLRHLEDRAQLRALLEHCRRYGEAATRRLIEMELLALPGAERSITDRALRDRR